MIGGFEEVQSNSLIELELQDLKDLSEAVLLLEDQPILIKLSRMLGGIFDLKKNTIGRLIPDEVKTLLQETLISALRKSLDTAIVSVDQGNGVTRWKWLDGYLGSSWADTAGVILSGAGGGAAGLPGTLVELPITTTILMRAIASAAAQQGEDLSSEESRLECLRVFALGSSGTDPEKTSEPSQIGESAYYAARIALAEAMGTLAGKTLHDVLPRVLSVVAARFGAPVTWKLAAGTLPLAGAASGIAVNTVFIRHYQAKSRGHFIVRRLERKWGVERVKLEYDKIRKHPIQ